MFLPLAREAPRTAVMSHEPVAAGGAHGGELRAARGGAGGDAMTRAADSVERDDSESLYGEEGRLCCFLAVNVSQLYGCKGSSGPRQMPRHIE